MAHYFRPLKPKMCGCGAYATQAYHEQIASGTKAGTSMSFCDTCADAKRLDISTNPVVLGRPRGAKKNHGEFGRSN